MMHQWAYTKEELTAILLQVGFTEVTAMEPKFHIPERDMRIEAVRP